MKIKIIPEEAIEHCDEEIGYTILLKYEDRKVNSLHLRNRRELHALMKACELAAKGRHQLEVDVGEQ